jgi:COG (conserved oligomeric Golgi) complex component, COG2
VNVHEQMRLHWTQVEVLTPRTGDAMHQPHWFRPKAFLSPDFDATAFIADLRRYVSADCTDQHCHRDCPACSAPGEALPSLRYNRRQTDVDLRPCVQVPLETLSSELENHLATLKLKVGRFSSADNIQSSSIWQFQYFMVGSRRSLQCAVLEPTVFPVSRSCSTPFHVQLVEVINEDYADFVSLSTQLVNVDGAVARMQRPLGDLKVLAVAPCMPEAHVGSRQDCAQSETAHAQVGSRQGCVQQEIAQQEDWPAGSLQAIM